MSESSQAPIELPSGDAAARGADAFALLTELFPICRSLTGEGVRRTLSILQEQVPLQVQEVPSGTQVLDWEVPPEWNIHDAWIRGPDGEKIVDFQDSNLHVLNYSVPVETSLTLEELDPHLYSLPDHPELIPYRTTYYNRDWGFCLRHSTRESLEPGTYEVRIDADLDEDGTLTYGEHLVEGERNEEYLVSSYICHPSIANDGLSGVIVAAKLAEMLEAQDDLTYSYRFLFIPETIGSITWLARNRDRLDRIRGGIVPTCVGDPGTFTYKRTRDGDARIDRVVERVLRDLSPDHEVVDFHPLGSDERQFNSPGFELPVGSIMRSPPGEYPEYHSSGDDLTLVTKESLAGTLELLSEVVHRLESEDLYVNANPEGEPQLGRRDLYSDVGGKRDPEQHTEALLWVLNLSDGTYSVKDIVERSGMDEKLIASAVQALRDADLLRRSSS